MKKLEVEVKSNKENLGSVDVEQFENIQEAIDFFQKEAGAEAKPDAGTVAALALINAQYKANVTNAYRVSKTRTVTPMTALKDKISKDPEARKKFEALLASFDIPA